MKNGFAKQRNLFVKCFRLNDLKEGRFLDAGSGSGLFSLAARRLGAEVHSFDFDPQSVACTRKLKADFFPNDALWQIDEASVLDRNYLESLGRFDVVYSWGVLHHTGSMWEAIANVAMLPDKNGKLFIAIYNDQGIRSRMWKLVKRFYCSGVFGRAIVKAIFIPYFWARSVAIGLVRHKNPFGYFRHYQSSRGMSVYHDWIDWLGGYPFEVASVAAIENELIQHGFSLENLIATKRLGCNQFVFVKKASDSASNRTEKDKDE